MNALEDIAAERKRQIEQEGWTVGHDDRHGTGTLAAAAACYALVATEGGLDPNDFQYDDDGEPLHPKFWPWDTQWWKSSTPRRDLVKAGALIVAEIERLDRSSNGATDNEDDPVPFPGHAIAFPTDGLGLGCSHCGNRGAQLSHPCQAISDGAIYTSASLPPVTESLEDEPARELFEAWSDTMFIGKASEHRVGKNGYSIETIGAAWLGWRAAMREAVSRATGGKP